MQRRKRGMFAGGFTLVAGSMAMATAAYACTYYQGTFTVTPTVVGTPIPSLIPGQPTSFGTYVTANGCDNSADASIPTPPISSDSHITSDNANGTAVGQAGTVQLATGTTVASATAVCTFNSPATFVPANVHLTAGTYDVAIYSAGYATYGDDYLPGCVAAHPTGQVDAAQPTTLLGQVVVNADGTIGASSGAYDAKTGALPGSPEAASTGLFRVAGAVSVGAGRAAICIQDFSSSLVKNTVLHGTGGTQHGNMVPIAITVI